MRDASGLRKFWNAEKDNPLESEHFVLWFRKPRMYAEMRMTTLMICTANLPLVEHPADQTEEQSTTEATVPLKKGFPFVISFVANPGPRGQSSSYSGVFLTGHSSHSSVPQAAPTEQQQASMRWRPAMGRAHSSSSYLRKQVSRRISARGAQGHWGPLLSFLCTELPISCVKQSTTHVLIPYGPIDWN